MTPDPIDPRTVTRQDFMQACNDNVVLYHIRDLWLMSHEISFEQALTAAVLILAEGNGLLRRDLEHSKVNVEASGQ